MRLSPELMRKLEGRTGKLSCRSCGSEVRLDFRGASVVVDTVEGQSSQRSAAEWLRQPSSPPPEVATVERSDALVTHHASADVLPEEEEIDEIFRTLVPGPPSSSSLASTSLASAASMLGSTPAPRSFQLVQDVSDHVDVTTMSSHGSSSRDSSTQRDSDPFVDSERAESLSPHVLDDDDDSALTHLGSADDSSPFSASLREAEINAIYSSMTPERRRLPTRASKIGQHARSVPPPLPQSLTPVDDAVARLEDALDLALPTPPLVTPKKSEPARPPRPWELAAMPAPSAPGPFDRFGLSSAPPVPQVVSLTPDGRLVNASDLPQPAARRMPFKSLGVFAVAGLALGALGAQPEVQNWIRPEATSAASAAPRTVVIDEPNVVVSEARVDAAAPAEIAPTEQAEVPAAKSPETAAAVAAPVTKSESLVSTPARAKKTEKAPAHEEPTAAEAPEVEAEASGAVDTSGATSKPDASEADATKSIEPSSGTSSEPAAPGAPPDAAVPGPFNSSAAQLALQTATAHAASCRREGDPSGTALVVITFAPSGRVTSATISGPPFVGTETGSCIASRFRGATVPAFTGDYVTVSKNVVIQ